MIVMKKDFVLKGDRFSQTFHCGDCVEVFHNDKWVATYFEMNREGLYLVGLEHIKLTPYVRLMIKIPEKF